MRTTVIPAQITTIEDKIAGNLNFTQVLLLIIPVFWTGIVYILFPPILGIALYKVILVLVVLTLCVGLSTRIKGKLILDWLVVLFRFNLRPKFYVLNKNEGYLRTLDLPVFESKQSKLVIKKESEQTSKVTILPFNISDLIRLERLINKRKVRMSFKSSKKGGLHVAFEQIRK